MNSPTLIFTHSHALHPALDIVRLKALELLEYLLRFGSDTVISDARERLFQMDALAKRFSMVDGSGIDRGSGVRARAEHLVRLLNDPGELERVRQEAKRTAVGFQVVIAFACSLLLALCPFPFSVLTC